MERRKAGRRGGGGGGGGGGGAGVAVFLFEFSPVAHGPNCGVSVNTSL